MRRHPTSLALEYGASAGSHLTLREAQPWFWKLTCDASGAHRQFTDTALGLAMTLLNAATDLISFSGILYSIYPPLFVSHCRCRPACCGTVSSRCPA